MANIDRIEVTTSRTSVRVLRSDVTGRQVRVIRTEELEDDRGIEESTEAGEVTPEA